MSKPCLYEYVDFRDFLRDWFEARKAADPRFTHRKFSKLAGQRSPSFISDVLERRRNLTVETAAAVARAMKLGSAESRFFAALVDLDRARDTSERNEAWQRISATRAFREARPIEAEGFRYLSHWYYPAIRELACLPEFQADPEWIAGVLRPSITVAEARRAMQALVDLGMLAPDRDGVLRPVDATVVTPHEVRGLAVHNYHHGMLDLAREAIERFRPSQRHFSAATISVPGSLVPWLKEELDALQERILDRAEQHQGKAEQVLQVHMHFFPLSTSAGEGAP